MTQEDLNEVLGKSLANYQLRQLAEDGGNLESALTLIDRLESELLNAQEHAKNLEFLLNQKDEKIDELQAKADAYDRIMSGGKKTLKEMSNFLGKIVVVHRDGKASWHEILPNKNEQWGIWVVRSHKDNHGDIPKDLILFDGDWQGSLTLPDGWEEI